MGINFNNFINSNLNQHIVDTLKYGGELKKEWENSRDMIKEISVSDYNEEQQAKILECDNRDSLMKHFGRYHFTLNENKDFFYVWKFIYDDSIIYIKSSKENTFYESQEQNKEIIKGFFKELSSYLK